MSLFYNNLVSVILPVYNAEKWMDAAIQSVIAQTYSNWELVVVDDGSIDNSLLKLQQWSAKDSRIKVFHQENCGPARARAWGLDKVVGDYIFYLDSDDTIADDMLESCLSAIHTHEADVAMPNLIQQKEGKVVKDNYSEYGISHGMVIDNKEAFYRSIDWRGVWSYLMCEVSLYKRFACNEKYLYGSFNSDELITRMVLMNCNKVVYCPARYYYNINPEGITKKITPKVFGYLETHTRLIQEGKAYKQPRNVMAKIETNAFREMIELWYQYQDFRKTFSEKERLSILRQFKSFYQYFPVENIREMLSVRSGVTPNLQRLLLLHGWSLCGVSLTLARMAGKMNKLYPWFSEEQIKGLSDSN